MFCELTQTWHLHAQHSAPRFSPKRFKQFVSADDLRTNKLDPSECVCIHRNRSKRAFWTKLLNSATLWDARRRRRDVLRYEERHLRNPSSLLTPPPPKTVGVWNNGLFARLMHRLCTLADRHTNAIGQLALSMLTSFLKTRLQLFCQCRAIMQWRWRG